LGLSSARSGPGFEECDDGCYVGDFVGERNGYGGAAAAKGGEANEEHGRVC